MLQQRAKMQWLKGGDQCTRVFFRRVAMRRASKRIFQISDDDGHTYTEPKDVSDTFVAYFERLLGGECALRSLDLRYLRPWARHVITEEESNSLTRPITADDVKTALFDIEEDRAPGPDGFSSGFFKAAWSVVGEDITAAVNDFFTTGRLLKQVNATLITLIPKVSAPSHVTDFRPISCCNVIYKIITKILVLRIWEVLDKLISPSQNAFVPGRSISDNVMLATELFSGYNQCRLPPRCALKVDLRKAYDTVEWDFLVATLHLFGFPIAFIRWIEECVTTPRFSLYLNGEVHGFFAGARGLRQGDPMSPCLFVLVMEVLHMIVPQFIKQDEVRSISLFRRGLDTFASLSGLHTNSQKSQLIISKAAHGLRTSLLDTLGFQEGHLPVRYLGLPLISSRLTISDCQPLFQKIDNRIHGWEGTNLSFAGRAQLIKSVLSALGGTTASGYPKVAWDVVCRPLEEGGQGIRDVHALNRTLMSHPFGLSSVMIEHPFRVASAGSFSLWHDPWPRLGPLILTFPWGPQLTQTAPQDRLNVVIENGSWRWPLTTDIACLEITRLLPPIHHGNDSITWTTHGGAFTTKAAYDLFRPFGPKVDWSSLFLGPFKIPRNSFILWLAILERDTQSSFLCMFLYPTLYCHHSDSHQISLALYGVTARSFVGNGTLERNAIEDDFKPSTDHLLLLHPLLLRKSSRGFLALHYAFLSALRDFMDYGISLGLSREMLTDYTCCTVPLYFYF
ncbi:Retrovirus-related Pol polyprotein from type-2 retrotransposable element R2DM [Sesamum angolense]|uniref:Retrovirus-related Pol polyprotein from type-2 retrotransposable element R2DM n=1 Tax=Sesamum angolense TaxID=2727404 RepID=A0AAE1VZF2_9LAMI|nr:Retrovirus-related Pol polyprotein from type-2 retrotransposable element R2DM [Sesamum angolense]